MEIRKGFIPGHVSKRRVKQFVCFSERNGYPLDDKEINPKHVIEWVLQLVDSEGKDIFKSEKFKHTFYFIMKKSKYPLALFLKLLHIEKLVENCTFVNVNHLCDIFNLFLNGSKKYATHPRGKDIIQKLPSELSEDRHCINSWFLTDTNECFKMFSVVDFYIWLEAQSISISFNNFNEEELIDVLERYLSYMKVHYSKGKYKKKRIFVSYILKSFRKETEDIVMLNQDTLEVLERFINSKLQGFKIIFKGQVINDSPWKGRNAVNNKSKIKKFLERVLSVRNYTERELQQFSIFSLNLNDIEAVYSKFGFQKEIAGLLKQLIPFLIDLGERSNRITAKEKSELENLFLRMPTKSKKGIKKQERGSNYLTRKDCVTIIQTAISTSIDRTKLRHGVLMATPIFTALRTGEAIQLQVGDFVLDTNDLLKDLGNGFGKLNLPDFKSKGGYSPSEKNYGTAVVPRLRELINMYLQSDFMAGYSRETYLFRKQPVKEYDNLFDNVPSLDDELAYGKWVDGIAKMAKNAEGEIYGRCLHLLETKIVGTVSFHDFRKSCNDWIKKTPISMPPDTIYKVAELHLRHKIEGGVNEEHYTSKPSLRQYIECINNALNFPWNLDDLEKWEKERNITYEEATKDTDYYPTIKTDFHYNSPIEPLIKEVCVIQMSPKQKQLDALRNEIKNLKQSLLDENVKNRILLEAKLKKLNQQLLELESD